MAENTTEENNTTKSMEHEMSSTSEISSADDRAVSSDKKKNHEQMDIDKPSTSKEGLDAEKEKIEDIDLLSPEKQQDASKTDCNGDLKEEETNVDKIETSEMVESETVVSETNESEKRNTSDELNLVEVRSSDEEYTYSSAIQSNLNEILKIVHGDLAVEMLQQHHGESSTVKDSSKENNEEEQTIKKKDDVSADDTAGSEKECTTSMVAKAKRDSTGSSEKTEEKSNFGIVRSPTAIGELIEEQLANNSALSTDRTDHIVEWVKNSVKVNANEESNIIEECKSENTTKEAEKRKNFNKTPPFISPRKSQKLVSNIIKKSIKW